MGLFPDWPTEHSEALRGFITDGLSFAKAAAAINEKFNTFYSRNALIGRAARMDIATTYNPHAPRIEQRKPPHERKPRVRKPYVPKKPIALIAREEVILRCAEVEPRHLSLMDLEPADCRFPYGDGPFTFCGHAVMEEKPWCPAHFHLTRKAG